MRKLKTLNEMITEVPTLLNFVSVPAPFNGAYLRDVIVERLGEVEPYNQKTSIFATEGALWFATHDWLFEHLKNIVEAEYSPIENYNRVEVSTEENGGTDSTTHTGTTTNAKTGTEATANTGTEAIAHTGTEAIAHTGTTTTETDKTKSLSGSESDTTDKTGTEAIAHTGTIADAKTGTETHAITESKTETHSGTDARDIEKEVEQKTSGFNSSTYQDSEKNTETVSDDLVHGEQITTSGTNGDTLTYNTTDTETHNNTDTTTYNTEEATTKTTTGSETDSTEEETTHNTTDTTTHNKTDTTTHNTTDTTTFNTTDTQTDNRTDALSHGHTIERESEIHGNIGVTTNQQMITQELELLKIFNAYDVIVSVFENDLFITCYNDYFCEG